jgi:peptidoglycan/LPS O-acetylase OafA/YrhL
VSEQELYIKPPKVALAEKLFYLIVGIGILRTAYTVVRHLDVRSPDFLIMTKFFSYAISVYLIYLVGKGKNWARWLLLIIFIVCIPLIILPFFGMLSNNPISGALGLTQLGLYLAGLMLVFHQSSRDWFTQKKTN